MAISKAAPAQKTTEHRTAEQPASSAKAANRTAADQQIRIQDPASEPAAAIGSPALISPELRQHLIRNEAYFRAERRGFGEGDPVQDWMEAEAEVDRILRKEQGENV
jgi:hypothetical protein